MRPTPTLDPELHRSAMATLCGIWDESIRTECGPKSQITALGGELFRLWARPLPNSIRRRRDLQAYRRKRNGLALLLTHLREEISTALMNTVELAAPDRLRAVARILLVSSALRPFLSRYKLARKRGV